MAFTRVITVGRHVEVVQISFILLQDFSESQNLWQTENAIINFSFVNDYQFVNESLIG